MSPAPRPRPLGSVALLLAVPAALLLTAAPSAAAPYAVWSCQGPEGQPLPGSAWTASASGTGTATAECSGGMRAVVPADRANVRGGGALTFVAPEGTRITGFGLARTLRASVGGLFPSGYAAGVASIDPPGPLGAGCSRGGLTLPTTCAVGDPPLTASGISVGGLTVVAGCTQDSCPSADPAAEATLTSSSVVLEDARPPVLVRTAGTLADTSRVVRALSVEAADVGGGVASVTAAVDGGRAARVEGGGSCAQPYAAAQPCPSSLAPVFGVDTGPLRPGDHVATGTISDAAGTAVPWGPVPFTVPKDGSSDLGPAPAGSVPVPVTDEAGGPDAATARLTLQGETTKAGRRRPTGYLRTRGGTPLSGVAIRLTRTLTGVTTPRTVVLPPVRTGANGRFAAGELPEGAWTVAAAADLSTGTVTASRRLRTGLRLSATPAPTRLRTGRLMVLSGQLTGAGPARAGVRVRIQTIVRGRYRTVAAVRTTSTGRWRWRHRFTKVSRPTLFSFRAVVEGEGADWPWAPVVRRAAMVRVDPR